MQLDLLIHSCIVSISSYLVESRKRPEVSLAEKEGNCALIDMINMNFCF